MLQGVNFQNHNQKMGIQKLGVCLDENGFGMHISPMEFASLNLSRDLPFLPRNTYLFIHLFVWITVANF